MRSFAALPLPRRGAGLALAATGALAVALLAAAAVPGASWQRLLVLVAVAPVLEETVFRAGVQEALLRWMRSSLAANVSTAALFAAAHVVARADLQAAWVALPAVAIGALYASGRRLGPCIAMHAAMNAAWLVWRAA